MLVFHGLESVKFTDCPKIRPQLKMMCKRRPFRSEKAVSNTSRQRVSRVLSSAMKFHRCGAQRAAIRRKKRRKGRRNRLKGARGRGTLAKEKPPIFGMIQRGGQVVIRILEDIRQTTIQPLIEATIRPGTLVLTDEYTIYKRLPEWGFEHQTVCHNAGGICAGRRW